MECRFVDMWGWQGHGLPQKRGQGRGHAYSNTTACYVEWEGGEYFETEILLKGMGEYRSLTHVRSPGILVVN